MAEDLKVERKELDLYDIIDLIWKNKFKVFVAPIILSLISFIYLDAPKKLFYYENEIFLNHTNLSKITSEYTNIIINIQQNINETCRNKYKFLQQINDVTQYTNILELKNDKRIKCKYDKENGSYSIIIKNATINDQYTINNLKQYPFIFFEFINNEVRRKIENQIRLYEETVNRSIRSRLNEIERLIDIEKLEIKLTYESAISQANLHLKVAEENNFILPQENAPGFGEGFKFFDDEKLYMNGVNALKVYIDSMNNRYEQDILNSPELLALNKEKSIIELQATSNELNKIPLSDFVILEFNENNEYIEISSKPSYIFLIVLFLSLGILIVSIILYEGYISRKNSSQY